MTAAEAREYNPPYNPLNEVEKVYESIKRAKYRDTKISHVNHSASLLSERGADQLRSQGYAVNLIRDWRDGDYYEIKW